MLYKNSNDVIVNKYNRIILNFKLCSGSPVSKFNLNDIYRKQCFNF